MKNVQTISDQFEERGFVGPIRLLSNQECQKFLHKAFEAQGKNPPLDWGKGYSASSNVFYDIAKHPAILEVVSGILGDDVMLWSAAIARRGADAVHPWHSDIDSAIVPQKTVSVWIGLLETNKKTSLQVIPYTHRFGKTIQEVRHQHGKGRDEATTTDVLNWAKEQNELCELITPDMSDGEAIIFDGHLWHYSHNTSQRTRFALILQYAVPEAKIRVPDPKVLDWPFKIMDHPRPGCIMVKGQDRFGHNRLVDPPVATNKTWNYPLQNRVDTFRMPLPADETGGFKSYPIFKGVTPGLQSMGCHMSVLNHEKIPHAPHEHKEEELFLLLDGEVELDLPNYHPNNGTSNRHIKAGTFFYYPAGFEHTLKTVSKQPATYLMFKWFAPGKVKEDQLQFCQYNFAEIIQNAKVDKGYCHTPVFKQTTQCLERLCCHVTTMSPGAGYEPHVDSYDVAILLLEGEVETLGQRVGPNSVVFYPAGQEHGMSNPGDVVAKYLVFEFHPNPKRSLLSKLLDPRCVLRKIKSMIKRA